MRVLLDTHTLLWAKISPNLLGPKASEILAESHNVIFVSAATAWEISTKVRLGKLRGAERVERDFSEVIKISGYTLLSIDGKSALRAGRFVADHKDPFDRIIAAQAIENDLPVLSLDTSLDASGVRRIW